jgi:hypothetical protein
VQPAVARKDQRYDEYPRESIAEWHRRLKLEC